MGGQFYRSRRRYAAGHWNRAAGMAPNPRAKAGPVGAVAAVSRLAPGLAAGRLDWLYGEDVTDELAYKVGRAYVAHTGARKVIVGRDMREHSVPMAEALAGPYGADDVLLHPASSPTPGHRLRPWPPRGLRPWAPARSEPRAGPHVVGSSTTAKLIRPTRVGRFGP